ncbi:MAG: hypothetical protein U1F43_24890 [Myxococcota bacterium]
MWSLVLVVWLAGVGPQVERVGLGSARDQIAVAQSAPGPASGRLGADDLRGLRAAIARTTFALAPETGESRCMAEPDHFVRIEAGAASITCYGPCAGGPDGSVIQLLDEVRRAVPR